MSLVDLSSSSSFWLLKGYCHHRRNGIKSSLCHLTRKVESLLVSQSGVLSAVLSGLLSSCLTSRRNVFSVDVFSSPRGDAISLWSKYPHRLPLSPVTMTFHKMSFCPCCTAPLSHKDAKFHLLSETFQQCGHVSFMLCGKTSLKRLYKHVTLSAAGGCLSFSSAETGERLWEVLRRCNCFPAFSH